MLDTPDSFPRLIAIAKSGEAKITLPARTESGTRRTDDIHLIQQLLEETPGRQSIWHFHPEIRCIDSAIDT